MSKTITKSTKQRDTEEALKLMEAYASLQAEKKTIDTSMKEAKEKLKVFATKYKKDFDENGRLVMGPGYLKWGDKTVVLTDDETFSMKKFAAKFMQYLDIKFKVNPLRKVFTDGDKRKQFDGYGISLRIDPEFSIKIKGDDETDE